jgi:hypothetical protein
MAGYVSSLRINRRHMQTSTETVVSEQEWNKLVKETYRRPYNFQQQDNCRERGTFQLTVPSEPEDYKLSTVPEKVNHPEMGVSFEAWLTRDPEQSLPNNEAPWALEMWWERNFYPDIQTVANDLCAQGYLAAGEYTINIDW